MILCHSYLGMGPSAQSGDGSAGSVCLFKIESSQLGMPVANKQFDASEGRAAVICLKHVVGQYRKAELADSGIRSDHED